MINWFNLATYTVFIVVVSTLIILLVKSGLKLKKSLQETVQLRADTLMLLDKISEMSIAAQNSSVEQTEGFVRFLSESRDWAFTYIEDVQQALLVYDIALSTDDAKIINDAYKKLISFLPEDS